MKQQEYHKGECLCGRVRYKTIGIPERAGVGCQLRSGSAFRTLVYFKKNNVKIITGDLSDYGFTTEMGKTWKNQFCSSCGTTILMHLVAWQGNIGVAGGTFDPPTFWYKLSGEVFMRSKGHFVGAINAPRKMDTWFNYEPKGTVEGRIDGIRNKK